MNPSRVTAFSIHWRSFGLSGNQARMKSVQSEPEKSFRFLVMFAAISVIATLAYFALSHRADAKGGCGSVGLIFGLVGTGGSFYTSFRVKQRRFGWVLAVPLGPFSYWAWQLYRRISSP